MQKLVFTNGGGQIIDLTSGNFGITNWEGLSNTGLNIQTQQVPFQDGGVFLDALMEQREISVTVAIQDNNDLSARYERKRQLISALNPKLGEGVLVYTNDYLSRQIKAVPQLPIFENKNSNDAGTLKANVTFSCCSPYWEDLEETVVAFGFNDQPIVTNNGDVPAQLNIEWETNDITNGTLENVTQKQKITYNGTLENNLHINTNVGQKSVSSERMGFEIVDTGSRNEISAYAKGIETTITIAIDGTGFLSKDGEEWQSVTVASNIAMYSVVYANNLHRFVAVGQKIHSTTEKIVRWSDDGITWRDADGTFSANFYQTVIYSEDKNLFIAVGAGGTISTSADGKEWNHITSGVASTIYGVCYSEMDSLFVAVGAGGVILTSLNGTTWTQRTSGATETDVFRRVCHSERLGLFVAVLNRDNGYISTDGINWTIVNIPLELMTGLCYSEIANKFLAVGAGGTVATSLDGTTWTTAQIQGTTERLYSACYSNNIKRFFTTGETGALYTSTDGIVWEIGKTGLNGTYTEVINVEELEKYFIAGRRLGQNTYLSILSSGTFGNWVECYESNITVQEVSSITYCNNTIIVCASSDGYFTSQDGINWTRHTVYATKIIFVADQNKYFRIYGTSIFSSTDLENWDTVTTFTNITSLIDICYSASKHIFVAIGQNTRYCAYSTDGVNWTETNISSSSLLGSYPHIAFSEELGMFIIAGNYVYTSYDGINWATRKSLISNYSRCIIYTKEKNQFLIGGRYVSSNGINWSDVSNYKQLLGVIYSKQDNCYYGVGGTTTVKSYVIPIGNCIDKLSTDSNIGMNLALGNNLFRVTSDSGDMSVVLRYRQKYIGV